MPAKIKKEKFRCMCCDKMATEHRLRKVGWAEVFVCVPCAQNRVAIKWMRRSLWPWPIINKG